MSRSKRLYLALGLDLALVALEMSFATVAHSTGLFSDSLHNLADALGLLLALFAVHLVSRAPSARHSFGMHRATILSALVNVAFLLVSCVLIAGIAIDRLAHLQPVRGGIVSAVAGGAILLNGLGALALADHSKDLNMRGVRLHVFGDALASAAIAIVGLIELLSHSAYVLDPIASLAIALLIAFEGFGIARSSIDVLLESTPEDIDPAEIADVIAHVEGVAQVHDLHVWSLSSEVRAASAHLVLSGEPTLSEARRVADNVRAAISERFSIAHATLEVEADPCAEDGEVICTIEALVPHDHREEAR